MKKIYLSFLICLVMSGFSYAQDSLVFLHSSYGNGYGSKIYHVDEGNGNTSLRIAVRGGTPNFTDAFYMRASDNISNGNVGIGTAKPFAKLHVLKSDGLFDPSITGTAIDNLMVLQTTYSNNPAFYNSTGYKWGIQFWGRNDMGALDQTKTGAVYAVSEDGGLGYNRAVGLAFHTTSFDANSAERLRITSTGNVGIGTPVAGARLTVSSNGGSSLSGAATTADFSGNFSGDRTRLTIGNLGTTSTSSAILFYGNNSANTALENKWEIGTDIGENHGRDMYFYNTNINNVQMYLQGDGNVGIGTTDSHGARFAVNGTIRSKEIKVEVAPWPDFVLKPSYRLPALSEVKSYIDKNQHLPDMPSEQEVAKEGINLGEMNRLLVKKVEELTLYVIKQQEQIDALTKKIETIQK